MLVLVSGQAWADYTNMCVADEQDPPTTLVTLVEGENNSYCEFCGYGWVEVEITNPYHEGSNSSDGDEEYETRTNNWCYEEYVGDWPWGDWEWRSCTESRRNSPDYGSPDPALDFDNDSLVIELTDGLELYTGAAPDLPLGGTVSGTNIITVNNMSDLAPGQTEVVRIPVHRDVDNTPEDLYNTSPSATATINYDMADNCSDTPGRRHNWRGDGWYNDCDGGGRGCSGDPNNPPTDFWQNYDQPNNQDSGNIDILQPSLEIDKQGWNYDSGQRENTLSDTIYGHNDDDIVWRLQLENTGDAPLQDLRIDDVLSRADVLNENFVCPDAASANDVADNNGALPSGSSCVSTDNFTGTVLNNWDVVPPFGDGNDIPAPYAATVEAQTPGSSNGTIDIAQGGTISLYLVGKLQGNASCSNGTPLINTFNDVQFGCAVQTPPGGIDLGLNDTGEVRTYYGQGSVGGGPDALQVERTLTGIDGSATVGMRGLMTITLSNQSGGTVWFDGSMDYHLRDELPEGYVLDPSYAPQLLRPEGSSGYADGSLYGSYAGQVDGLEWVNPAGGVDTVDTNNFTDYLNNTAPEFKLFSTTDYPDANAPSSDGSYRDLMRHGDVVVLRFAIIYKNPEHFDLAADLDVVTEEPGIELYQRPEPTDPPALGALENILEVQFKTLCDAQVIQSYSLTNNGTSTADDTGATIDFDPEDLDVEVLDESFIVTNDPDQTTPLRVRATNNGGVNARDANVFISFGPTLEVTSVAPQNGNWQCDIAGMSNDLVPQPTPYTAWVVNPPGDPDQLHLPLPSSPYATVYRCYPNHADPLNRVLAPGPGEAVEFHFEVRKDEDSGAILEDDVTFRADAIGEIWTVDDLALADPTVDMSHSGGNTNNRVVQSFSTTNTATAITNHHPQWFPQPGNTNQNNARSDGEVDRGNLYSLDAHWSRGIGFNLMKDQVAWSETGGDTAAMHGAIPTLGECNEDNPAALIPALPDSEMSDDNPNIARKERERVQIGEECTNRIQTGGWFGFESRGFSFIGVRDVLVQDQVQDGLAYISNTEPQVTPQIEGATPEPNQPTRTPLEEGLFGWEFTGSQPGGDGGNDYIITIDQWFHVNATTRVQNKAENDRNDPNEHGADRNNIVNSSFEAAYHNENTGEDEYFDFDGTIVGYPWERIRRTDVMLTEPKVEVAKLVCDKGNFSADGSGGGTCSSGWQTDIGAADTSHNYVFRLFVCNGDIQNSDSPAPSCDANNDNGQPRAPAYDLVVTDTIDTQVPTDLIKVIPFNEDGLDNDGDGQVDEGDEVQGDAANSFSAISDNVLNNSTPPVLTFSHEVGVDETGLRRIDNGDSVSLFYEINPDERLQPNQVIVNNVTIDTYDSLAGSTNEHGNQTVETPGNGDVGGARIYPDTDDQNVDDQVTLTLIQPQAEPKEVINTSLNLDNSPEVVIGEEVQYQLTARLPVAQLRNLQVVDNLPAGLSCSDAADVDLSQPPWDGAGFKRIDANGDIVGEVPPISIANGGITCTDSQVTWNFGNVSVENATPGDTHFIFPLTFVAGVDNSAGNNDGEPLTNGGGSNDTDLTNGSKLYWQEASGTERTVAYGEVDVEVTEPEITAFTKDWDISAADTSTPDAGDEITITVSLTNSGSAAAYNLRVLDTLHPALTYVADSEAGAGAPDSVDYSDPKAPIFIWGERTDNTANNPLAAGASREFTFRASVDTEIQPHTQLSNSLVADWTSLPNAQTALNRRNSIGADGDPDGMRIGSLDNSHTAPNDYVATSNEVDGEIRGLTLTKNDLTPALAPEIGAHKQFELVIDLPEGTTQNLQVADQLDSGSVSYLLARDEYYDVSYTFTGIDTINDDPPEEAAFDAVPAHGESGTVEWDIGTVITETENDLPTAGSVVPQIVITYYARINNDLNTNGGNDGNSTLENGATVDYTDGQTGTAAATINDGTSTISVTESDLVPNKAVEQVGSGQLTAGSVLEYTLSLENTGDATAYDVNIVDHMDAGLELDSSFTPTISGITDTSGFDATPDDVGAGVLTWGRDNTTDIPAGDGSLDIEPGQTLVLTYRAVVTNPDGTFTNTANVDWTSLQDDVDHNSDYERTGDGCPNFTDPDDYCVSATVETDEASNDTAIAKVFDSDSWVDDGSDNVDARLRVGDTVDYQLTLTLNENLTEAVTLTDVLPAGLAFDQIVSVNGDTTAPFDPAGDFDHSAVSDPTLAGDASGGQTLTFNLGDIDNTDDDGSPDDFVIVYRAEVVVDVLDHVDTLGPLDNTATLEYSLSGNAQAPETAGPVGITVNQPVLTALEKTDTASGRTGAGTQTDPYQVVLATDTMQFRLQTCNEGDAPAYNVQLSDTLATQLDESALADASAFTVEVGGTVTTDFSYSGQPDNGGNFALTLNDSEPLLPDQCLTVDYSVGFHADVTTSEIFHNSASLDSYWSLPGEDGQQYTDDTVAEVWMQNPLSDAPLPVKTLLTANTATIGEEVRYSIEIPADNIARADVVLTDDLAGQFAFIGASLSIDGGTAGDLVNNGTDSSLSFDLGTLQAGEEALVELTLRVVNNADSNAGDSVINQASYSTGGNTHTSAASDPLTITEPQLALDKSVVNQPADISAGSALDYRLTITESGNADSAQAHDLVITDTLDPGLEYVSNSSSASIGEPTISGDPTNGQTLEWTVSDLAVGTSQTLDYQVEVQDTVSPGQTLGNSAQATWTGLPGTPANPDHERDGSETPEYNDYVTEEARVEVMVSDNTTFDKALVDDTFGGNGTLRVGDRAHFALTLTLQNGTYPNLVVSDTLPTGLVFEEVVSADFFGSDETATVVNNTNVNGSEVTFELGNVTNPADAASDKLVIVYEARVENGSVLSQEPTTQTLGNNATLDYDLPSGPADTLPAQDSLDVLQPLLDISSVSVTTADGNDGEITVGEQATFTVDIVNNGPAPAYDLQIRDLLPEGMRNSGGATTQSIELLNNGPLPVRQPNYDAATGIALWDLDDNDVYTIPAGDTLRLVYTVDGDDSLGAGLEIENSVTLPVYYSFDNDEVPANGQPDERQPYSFEEPVSATLTTPLPEALSKDITQPEAAIGEPFAYRITVPATPADTALYDVRIIDDLSTSAADLGFVAVDKISGSGDWTPENIGSGSQVEIADTTDGIDIPAGEQIEIELVVELLDTETNVAGLTFNNTASYTFSTFEGDESALADTSPDMTLVEPDLTLVKSGPDVLHAELAGEFTLDIESVGDSSAWDIAVVDVLPDVEQGGMCATEPEIDAVRIVADDGSTLVRELVEGTDYQPSYADCTLTLQTTGVELEPAQHLIVEYRAWLDEDTAGDQTLANVAAAQWFSQGEDSENRREYGAQPTNGTPDILDHEDNHELVTESATLQVLKEAINVTTGQNPGVDASPGDTLRYEVTVNNVSEVPLAEFSIEDELGVLNNQQVFEAGTLTIDGATLPAGASDNSDASGGAAGTGWVNVGNLSLSPQGESGDSVTVAFEVQLAEAINDGTEVLNQSEVIAYGQILGISDDPNINGAEDPEVEGDEDPTRILIESAPDLLVEKTSEDITDDPDLLMAGDTLRYTLSVENTGDENIVDAILRDQVPANTTYVAGSTTLNGAEISDGGASPLSAGLAINTAGEEEGFVAAGEGIEPVLVTFDVTINDVSDGTIISNQGFVNGAGAGSGPFEEKASDDPATSEVDDPTIDIVGDVPLLLVGKTVAIAEDNLSPGIVDPEDVLRYTITIRNMGGVDATNVELTDLVPADTTYVAGTTTLNGSAVADSGGDSALTAGLAVNTQGAGSGTVASTETATVTFDVRVDAGTATGTVISNQGEVSADELPLTLTDADGNPSNGAQPTEIVVGDAQQLSIAKEVAVVGGGAALPGATLEYLVRVTNIGAVPATDVVISDDLLLAGDGVLTYVDGSAQLNGQAAGVSVTGSVITANQTELAAGDSATLRFRATIGSAMEIGFTITNIAEVQWNDPASSNEASVSIDVGGTPGIANLAGALWHDVNFNGVLDGEERLLQNWNVELYFDGALLESAQSDENGLFQFGGLVPNGAGSGAGYELRYAAPNAGENTASLGNTSSDFTDGPQQITEIFVGSGSNPQNLNLPIAPNGAIYDSVQRQPVSGATVTMLSASSGQELPDRCFDDRKQQGQVTRAGGYYKFDINFSEGACAANSDYLIRVQMSGEDYIAGESQIIPPQTNVETAGFDVGACLGGTDDLIGATPDHCEVQLSAQAPGIDIDARSGATDYYLRLRLDDDLIPGESQLFNNHIPVDPQLDGALSITKTAALLNVTRSQLVPYTITFSNTLGVPMRDLRLMDFFPAGFKYVAGSAQVDGVAMEPEINGLQMSWSNLDVEPDQTRTVKMLLVVGSGVGEGKYVNRARMYNQLSGQQASGEASATVRVVPDPTFDCSDVIGKVYDDKNMNGYQDDGEGGVPGARVVTATGLNATTDAHGRFHITCAVVPNQDRGSNFIMKLDDRSLPSGYRLTSENPRVVRATRGKAIKVNFGTSLHRVVRLDMAEAVFEPQTTELRPQWHSRTELLLEKLSEAPSVLRLSYLAENEEPALVERRLQAIKAQIADEWARDYGDYELTIETEVFWRRGAPPSEGGLE
ncbi:isopeptide-forming domain-containing fimbrial protein [Microbulbifer halophilus]|uniref:Isopeptide-forming domain-containing fimbrial protein n=1 Tax=Microbulbifer halophilus TaxID=453963 RepID=A0ABW5EI47_9GAMM